MLESAKPRPAVEARRAGRRRGVRAAGSSAAGCIDPESTDGEWGVAGGNVWEVPLHLG